MNLIDKRVSWWENCIHYVIIYSIATWLLQVTVFQVPENVHNAPFFMWSERVVVGILTIEYFYRMFRSEHSWKYAFKPLGLLDLMAILPYFIGIFFVHGRIAMHVIRSLRTLRILKLYRYSDAMQEFLAGIKAAMPQLQMVGQLIFVSVLLFSSLEMELERVAQPNVFGTFAGSAWWCIVTMSTVGYGDEVPMTTWGKILAIPAMVVGVAIMSMLIGIIGGIALHQVKHTSKSPESATSTITPSN